MDWPFLALGRPLTASTAAGPGRLLLAELHGEEGVNELFAFRLHLLAPKELPPLTLSALVGRPASATLRGPVELQLTAVQFWWDRQGEFDANSSRWVRCAQLWAGKDWGAFFWPRPGMEVVVHFENGDPDRPLITGCVYNGENVPPGVLPARAGVAGVKSCVLGGEPGVEYIQLHSERDEVQRSQSNRFGYTPGLAFNVHGRL